MSGRGLELMLDGVEERLENGSMLSGLWEGRDKYLRKTPKASGNVVIQCVTVGSLSPSPSSGGWSGSRSGRAGSALAFAASNCCFFVKYLPTWIGTFEVGI